VSKKSIHSYFSGADEGQALVEYALIIGFVALVSIASLTALGVGADALLQSVPSGL
jgi:Flp pilus assembly pilin Flp